MEPSNGVYFESLYIRMYAYTSILLKTEVYFGLKCISDGQFKVSLNCFKMFLFCFVFLHLSCSIYRLGRWIKKTMRFQAATIDMNG